MRILLLLLACALPAAAQAGEDIHMLTASDLTTLATRAAKVLTGCKTVHAGTAISLGDVSNHTDEHVDKSALTEALTAQLSKFGVTLAAAGAALSLVLTSEKNETPKKSYVGIYRLELLVQNGAEGCRKQAKLVKKSVK